MSGGLWDAIRGRLRERGEEAELHLFGAYVNHAAQQLHDPVLLVLGFGGFRAKHEGIQNNYKIENSLNIQNLLTSRLLTVPPGDRHC